MFDHATAPAGEDMFDAPVPIRAESEIKEEGGSRWMPHPETGAKKKFVRATQFAGTLSDEYVLNEWKMAMVALGIGRNRGLYARSNAEPLPTEPMEHREKGWWVPWSDIAHEAIDSAQAKSGAHLGTAVHSWVEQIEAGERGILSVPKEWREHIRAHLRIHEEQGIKYVPEWREGLIVNLAIGSGVCGRFDALRMDTLGRLIVDDTKTGKNAPEGIDEIAIQLAIYANAGHMWAPDLPESVNGYVPMPSNIRKDVAMVSWVPIDRPEEAEVIPVDIKWGWEAAQAIAWTLAYRRRSKRVVGSKMGSLRLSRDVLTAPTNFAPVGKIWEP